MKSETDWSKLMDPESPGVPTSEHPEAEIAHVVRGVVRRGLQPTPSKSLISLRIDQDVIELHSIIAKSQRARDEAWFGRQV